MESLFSRTELSVVSASFGTQVPKCGACGLLHGCKSPKMGVAGLGGRKVLIVGEAPGATEDDCGRPFVGKAGGKLKLTLAKLGVALFDDCWVTNSIICRPPDNRTPTDKELEYCNPNVRNAIKEYNPVVIVPLGNPAVKSILGWLWRPSPGSITRWAGYRAPCQELNAWVCPTFHPSYVEREKDKGNTAPEALFTRHLKAAFKLTKRPWKKVPDFASRVETHLESDSALKALKEVCSKAKVIAFDFETNMLKPDSPRARIACCSVSDGRRSVAFMWRGAPVKFMRRLLSSDVIAKIAANMKFEDRWTEAQFGFHVSNWHHDTMVGAHVLDNRKEVSGLKFQAFARLGQRAYNLDIEKYLESKVKGGYEENRVFKAPADELLHYCGMDSLLEYHLARLQRRDLGLEDDK